MKRRQLFRLALASPAVWLVRKYGLPSNVDHELHIPMPSGVLSGDVLIACVGYWHEGRVHQKTSHAIVAPDGSIHPVLDLGLPGPVPAAGAIYAVRYSEKKRAPQVAEVRIALADKGAG